MKTIRVIAAFSGLLMCSAAHIALAQDPAPRVVSIDIAAQPLGDALNEFGKQANLTMVFYDAAIAHATQSQPLAGKFTTQDALTKLLTNTGLTYQYLDERTIAIRAVGTPIKTTAGNTTSSSDRISQLSQVTPEQQMTAAQKGGEDSAAGSGQKRSNDENQITEIVVTAQKRTERLSEVPVPVTAISGDTLVQSNQLRLNDYYTRIPG